MVGQRVGSALLVMGFLVVSAAEAGASSRSQLDAQQAELDAGCEAAREKILGPERDALVEECVRDKFPRDNRAGCERFYADHGAATAGGRAPLHMDLPECVEAHEFRQNRGRR
jgi:hypothetical protein